MRSVDVQLRAESILGLRVVGIYTSQHGPVMLPDVEPVPDGQYLFTINPPAPERCNCLCHDLPENIEYVVHTDSCCGRMNLRNKENQR